jgi:hypothetical protein
MKRNLRELHSTTTGTPCQATGNDTFIDDLYNLMEEIYTNSFGIFGCFWIISVDANGRTLFDKSNSKLSIRLNKSFRCLKSKLWELMDLVKFFTKNVYANPGIRYLSKNTTTEDVDELLDRIIDLYAKFSKMALPQFRPIVKSRYQDFVFLIRVLNTAIGTYNLSPVGKQFPVQQL